MATNKKPNQTEVIRQKDNEIAILKDRVSRMDAALAKTSRNVLVQDLDEANKEIKKEHKFNVKAWLIASIFSITSCLIGIANMIIHFVDKH